MYWANINNNPKGVYSEKFITKIKNKQRNEVQRSSKITSFGDIFFR